MTPEEALRQFQQVTGLRVFAVLEPDGTAWWAKPETETEPPTFECTIGDRILHIDELASGITASQPLEHDFVPGGDDSAFGGRGTWCAVWINEGTPGEDQCGRPREQHGT